MGLFIKTLRFFFTHHRFEMKCRMDGSKFKFDLFRFVICIRIIQNSWTIYNHSRNLCRECAVTILIRTLERRSQGEVLWQYAGSVASHKAASSLKQHRTSTMLLMLRQAYGQLSQTKQQQQPLQPLPKQRRKKHQLSLSLKLYGVLVFFFWLPSFLQAASRSLFFPIAGDGSTAVASVAIMRKRRRANQTDASEDEAVMLPMENRTSEFVYSRYDQQQPPLPAYGNVLLYLTSDLSDSHMRFLQHCWPALIESSPLLRNAHVLVYTNPVNSIDGEKTRKALSLIQNTVFANNPSLRIFVTNTTTAQKYGPIDSMWQSTRRQWWWSGTHFATSHGDPTGGYPYHWVLRIHPHVLIRNETFLVDTMQDVAVEGIFSNCGDGNPCTKLCRYRRVHSDVMLFRPESFRQKGAFFVPTKNLANASSEHVARYTLQMTIRRAADRWMTGDYHNTCSPTHEDEQNQTSLPEMDAQCLSGKSANDDTYFR